MAQLSLVINQPTKAEACTPLCLSKTLKDLGNLLPVQTLAFPPFLLPFRLCLRQPECLSLMTVSASWSLSFCLGFKILPVFLSSAPASIILSCPPLSLAAAIDPGSQLGHKSLCYLLLPPSLLRMLFMVASSTDSCWSLFEKTYGSRCSSSPSDSSFLCNLRRNWE